MGFGFLSCTLAVEFFYSETRACSWTTLRYTIPRGEARRVVLREWLSNSYEDDFFTALSEHGDATNADCGEERDFLSRPSRTLPFRSRLARPLLHRFCIAHRAPCPRPFLLFP